MKLWQKGLIGCGIGCALLVVLAVIGLFSGAYWVFAPGEQIATEQIVAEESVGAFHLESVRGDTGAREFVNRFLQEFGQAQSEQQREQLPESMRWLQDLDSTQGSSGLGWLIPKDMTVTLEQVDGDPTPRPVLAVNFSTFPRMFRWLMTETRDDELETMEEEVRAEVEADPRIIPIGDGRAAFFGSTLLVSDGTQPLLQVLNRLDAGKTAESEASSLLPASVRERFDFYGTLVNVDGYLEEKLDEWWARRLAGEDEEEVEALREIGAEWAGTIEWVRVGIDFRSASEADLEVQAECSSVEAAEHWAQRLEELARVEVESRLAEEGVAATYQTEVEGRSARLIARLSGLEHWVKAQAALLVAKSESGDW